MDLPALGQLSHRWRRYWDMSMGRLDPTGSDGYRTDTDSGDAKLRHGGADTDHVSEGIKRPDLVEVHVLSVDAVDVSLGVCEPGEHSESVASDPIR
jgi:hypothetical protein